LKANTAKAADLQFRYRSENRGGLTARILVAEDNPNNLELITCLLKAFGHETFEAHDGREALEVAARERPDLILMDIHMPVMDGYEAACRLRKDSAFESTPILAITALAMVGDREKILQAGFDGYVSKPIDPETFVQHLDPYLRREGAPPRRATPQTGGTDPTSVTSAPLPPTLKGASVLVVDNVPTNIQVLRSLLEPSGYEVNSAPGVAEALAKLGEHLPDLIVSDVHMPGLSGYDFIRAVKSDSRLRHIPFMFITSTVLTGHGRQVALRLGADKFVGRPIDPEKLLAEIEDLLQRRRDPAGDGES
jgi:two-component system cell cycle response regulator